MFSSIHRARRKRPALPNKSLDSSACSTGVFINKAAAATDLADSLPAFSFKPYATVGLIDEAAVIALHELAVATNISGLWGRAGTLPSRFPIRNVFDLTDG